MAIVICCRLTDPHHREVPGAVVRTCARCGKQVSVSPSHFIAVRSRVNRLICVQCAAVRRITEITEDGRVREAIKLTKAEKREIREFIEASE